MANTSVNSGETSSGITVSNPDQLVVFGGGTVIDSVVSSGGTELLSGGLASGTTVSSGGVEFIGSGSVASGTTISGGGIQVVQSGGLGVATLVSSGGFALVTAGGGANGNVIFAGGNESLAGGIASGNTVAGGQLTVSSGGTAIATVISGGGAADVVLSGGFATGSQVFGGGAETVFNGGVAVGAIIGSGGSENVGSGGSAGSTTVASGGFETVSSGGQASGTNILNGGAQVVSSGGLAAGTVVSSGGALVVQNGGTIAGTVLQPGGFLDLKAVAFDSAGSIDLDTGSGVATIVENGGTVLSQFAGDYTGLFFHLSNDGSGQTLITVDGTPCYCRGTRIMTLHGGVPVEDLTVGQRVVNAKGEPRPIRWIGRRSYAGRFAAGNRDVMPILIHAGALGDGVPHRDLFVSPLHAMFIDGMLIPAGALVNGTTIEQVNSLERIDYFHIELDTHDIILAEGALSETFVDDDSRGMFHNAAEYQMLYPDAERRPARYCAPRVEDGEALETVRRKLAKLARGEQPDGAPDQPPHTLDGRLDMTRRDRIQGWAFDSATPHDPIILKVYNNGIVIGEVAAADFRQDLKDAGIGDGRHGFELVIPGGLSPLVRHVIHVRRASDGADLPNTPWILRAAPAVIPTVTAPVEAGSHCEGCIDDVTRDRISGWAFDPAAPDAPVALQILDNGVAIARILANQHRPDLEAAGIGEGRHGFDIRIPGGLSPLGRHVIQVRNERDGTELANSPVVIEPADSFDATLEQAVANAVASVEKAGDRDRVLSFVLAQADRLRQQRADTDAQRAERAAFKQASRREGPAAGTPEPERRALVIDTRVPQANRDAGSRAILSHMRALRAIGYAVSFAAADEMTGSPDALETLRAEGIACHTAPYYSSIEEVLRRQAGCFDVVYLHRADIAGRYMTLARTYCPQANIVYSVADLHHIRLERQAAAEERPELIAAARRMQLMECTATWSADTVITHSSAEVEVLRGLVPNASVHRVPWAVPIGRPSTPLSARRGVAFVGGYSHTPNRDAAHWLVETIMPMVWREDPSIECLLVGSEMPAVVRKLARPGVLAIGEVADLHDSVFERVRLTVAPLRYGAGVKGKILDSLAAGIPCAMNDVAAEGLDLPPSLRPLVGQGPEALAALICRLHREEKFNADLSLAGRSFIRDGFSQYVTNEALRSAMEGRSMQPMSAAI